MTDPDTRLPTTPEASGPLIALCAGHRCEALHRLADDRTGADRVRTTVATGRGAVLITAPCLGACASGAVAAVARRDAATGTTGPSVWLGGVDQSNVLDALLDWLASGGPARIDLSTEDVPDSLQHTILGVGHPIRVHGPHG